MTENLAKRIIKYRATHDLSMADFAKLCLVNPQTIWLIETGRTRPSRVTTQKILGVIEENKE